MELQGDDIERAADAFDKLDRLADSTWVPRLYRALAASEDVFVRESLAVPLARLEGPRALPALLDALRRGQEDGYDNDSLVASLWGIPSDAPAPSMEVLRPLLAHQDTWSRAHAAWLWGFLPANSPVGPLLPLLADPEPEVRREAAGALGSFDAPNVRPALQAALSDPVPEVRAAVAGALRFIDERH